MEPSKETRLGRTSLAEGAVGAETQGDTQARVDHEKKQACPYTCGRRLAGEQQKGSS